MPSRPTISDVAREAGVSRTTVSHALRGMGQVESGTRQRVIDAAAKLGYRPSVRMGVRVALVGAAIVAFVAIGGLAHDTTGAQEWNDWISVALLGLSVWGVVVAYWRSRLEARSHWGVLITAFAVSALGETLHSIGVTDWLGARWPSPADVGAIAFEVLLFTFFIRHLRAGDRRNLWVHLLDSSLIGLAVAFFSWELVISPATGHLADHGLSTQVLVVAFPVADLFLCSILLLLLMVARSPARAMAFTGLVLVTVGDIVKSTVWLLLVRGAQAILGRRPDPGQRRPPPSTLHSDLAHPVAHRHRRRSSRRL